MDIGAGEIDMGSVYAVLYLGSVHTLSLLSRPKGRNCRAEELGRGRRETASPQGRSCLMLTRMGVCRTTSSLYVRRHTGTLAAHARRTQGTILAQDICLPQDVFG